MRSKEDFQSVRDLLREGLNDCEISRRTGVPLTTVGRWRANPEIGSRRKGKSTCPICDDGCGPAADYAYLLGLYLGDGHIAKCRRDVLRLDISLDSRYPAIISESVRMQWSKCVNTVSPQFGITLRGALFTRVGSTGHAFFLMVLAPSTSEKSSSRIGSKKSSLKNRESSFGDSSIRTDAGVSTRLEIVSGASTHIRGTSSRATRTTFGRSSAGRARTTASPGRK